MIEFGNYLARSLLSLLPVIDPISIVPVFIALTAKDSIHRQRAQARRAALYMIGILLTFLLAGGVIFEFFGLSLAGLRIAGGLVILHSGWQQLNSGDPLPPASRTSAVEKRDISLTPLALPLLSGPGAIAATMSLAIDAPGAPEYMAIGTAIVAAATLTYVLLYFAPTIAGWLGETGQDAVRRLMGFLVVCIGVEYIVSGVRHAF